MTHSTTRANKHGTQDGYKYAAPVGSYPAGVSPYGALDMAGNVWEWTSSKVMPHPYDANDGRETPEGSDARSLRGGSWHDDELVVRCAYLFGDSPNTSGSLIGFRLVSPGFGS